MAWTWSLSSGGTPRRNTEDSRKQLAPARVPLPKSEPFFQGSLSGIKFGFERVELCLQRREFVDLQPCHDTPRLARAVASSTARSCIATRISARRLVSTPVAVGSVAVSLVAT